MAIVDGCILYVSRREIVLRVVLRSRKGCKSPMREHVWSIFGVFLRTITLYVFRGKDKRSMLKPLSVCIDAVLGV